METLTAPEKYHILQKQDYWIVTFHAMASPCELLIDTTDRDLVECLASLCVAEVQRIEHKFSRYRTDNLCHSINTASGQPTPIDGECYRLLTYAQTCFDVSEGLFDLTSGILRRAWCFDGSDNIPSQTALDELLPNIGWEKVSFNEKFVKMPNGMEIDFGGIGKEYAVSQLCNLCAATAPHCSVLINLGGDIQVTRSRNQGKTWRVGIDQDSRILSIESGALATSGDRNRYVIHDGRRFGHILNPRTGWPNCEAPASVTVQAPLCIQAGTLATLAILQGAHAESFLRSQATHYWCTYS